MTPSVVFVDTETTGLQAGYHEIWEVGLIYWSGETQIAAETGACTDAGWVERSWLLPVDLQRADARALDIGGFHDRHPFGARWTGEAPASFTTSGRFAAEFVGLTWGKHLVGAVPSFDEERLRKLVRGGHRCHGWHYHLVDVEALAAGHIANGAGSEIDLARPPWDSNELSMAMGVDPQLYDRHTALGDARWAKAIYEAVLG